MVFHVRYSPFLLQGLHKFKYSTNVKNDIKKIRNIGISAHIDSGKTTLSERILYYTGKIDQMHEVKGKDNVGAKMDSMELERQRGITIKSAATYVNWNDHKINIIDTPGHVDFTIEVERALRVLDSAVLVICSVGGVQCQTHTVVRQMNRYSIPYLTFINKLDRNGADPYSAYDQIRTKIHQNSALMQIPMGFGNNNRVEGLIDLITRECIYFKGNFGTEIVRSPEIPANYKDLVDKHRSLLIEVLSGIDEEIGSYYIQEQDPPHKSLHEAIRRNVISRKFFPILLGSALKNTGVQTLLDAVVNYLPNPTEVTNYIMDNSKNPIEKVKLRPDKPSDPMVCLAFKLESGSHGNLIYLRTYQGTLNKGDFVYNTRTQKRFKVTRLVKLHSDELEEMNCIEAGDICALFGGQSSSSNIQTGDTLVKPMNDTNVENSSDNSVLKWSMESMFVPEPVISMSIKPDTSGDKNLTKTENSKNLEAFGKAITRFAREDPTFRIIFDQENQETLVQGMGELHLEIYKQRMEREYNVKCIMGAPKVAFRETIESPIEFDYLHKKQTGGAGQYARVIGVLEPLPPEKYAVNEFVDNTVGTNVPNQFISSIKKGFEQICHKGSMTGHRISGVRFNLQDGDNHVVDSNDIAFVMATIGAIKQTYEYGTWIIIEPIMNVEISVPNEFQGILMPLMTRKNAIIINSNQTLSYYTLVCEVPLDNMFGFASELRSITQGKGEFTMEFCKYAPALPETQRKLVKIYQDNQQQLRAEKMRN